MKTVEEVLALFEKHPAIMAVVAVASLAAWIVRTDALGFVSRRKRLRRGDVLETFQALVTSGGMSDEERASLRVALRESGEGLNCGVSTDERLEVDELRHRQSIPLSSPLAKLIVRVTDGFFSALVVLMMVSVVAGFVLFTAAGFWLLATSGGDGKAFLCGFFLGPGGVLYGMWLGPKVVRDVAKKHPRVLEALDWFERKTEKATKFGTEVALSVFTFGSGLYFLSCAVFVATESETLVGWSLAIALGLFGLAMPVRMSMKFFGLFGGDRRAEVGRECASVANGG